MANDLTAILEQAGPFSVESDAATLREARSVADRIWQECGFKGRPAKITTPPTSNVKMGKGERVTVGLTLSPANVAGLGTVCRFSTAGCRAACVLQTAGKGTMENVQRARRARTAFLVEEPELFVALVAHELRGYVARFGPVLVRLNTASDLRWELIAPELFELEGCAFYDYTKWPMEQRFPGENYVLVKSVSELTGSVEVAADYVRQGGTAAVVLDVTRGHELPATWQGLPVVDGDLSDDRTADPAGVWVALRAKGAAIGDDSGFVKAAV